MVCAQGRRIGTGPDELARIARIAFAMRCQDFAPSLATGNLIARGTEMVSARVTRKAFEAREEDFLSQAGSESRFLTALLGKR